MLDRLLAPLRGVWEALLERLIFLPPFPESIDSLALFSLLLVVGLLIGEWLHAHAGWPKVIGYVLAGTLFGPELLGWISLQGLAPARPAAGGNTRGRVGLDRAGTSSSSTSSWPGWWRSWPLRPSRPISLPPSTRTRTSRSSCSG